MSGRSYSPSVGLVVQYTAVQHYNERYQRIIQIFTVTPLNENNTMYMVQATLKILLHVLTLT